MWARQLGELSGVTIPNQAAEHYYLITDEIEGLSRELPVLEDPSHHAYYREETGGLMIGLFEPEPAPWKVGGIPDEFLFCRDPSGLGSHDTVPGKSDEPGSDLDGNRDQEALLRTGELHPGFSGQLSEKRRNSRIISWRLD